MFMSKFESKPSFTKKMQHFFQETTSQKKERCRETPRSFFVARAQKIIILPHPIRNDVGALKEVRKFSLVCAWFFQIICINPGGFQVEKVNFEFTVCHEIFYLPLDTWIWRSYSDWYFSTGLNMLSVECINRNMTHQEKNDYSLIDHA